MFTFSRCLFREIKVGLFIFSIGKKSANLFAIDDIRYNILLLSIAQDHGAVLAQSPRCRVHLWLNALLIIVVDLVMEVGIERVQEMSIGLLRRMVVHAVHVAEDYKQIGL